MITRSAIVAMLAAAAVISMSTALAVATPGSRIVGGTKANESQVKVTASVEGKAGGHFCGATVIAQTWLITAAHCVTSPPATLQVRIGSRYNNSGGSVHGVVQTYRHPEHDLGLIRTESAMVERADVALDAKDMTAPGTDVWIVGWGRTCEWPRPGCFPNDLRQVKTKIVDIDKCDATAAYEFCAGGGGRDSCEGDSGGPVFLDANSSRLTGIVSRGFMHCGPHAGTYVKVTPFKSWIEQHTGSLD